MSVVGNDLACRGLKFPTDPNLRGLSHNLSFMAESKMKYFQTGLVRMVNLISEVWDRLP